VYFESDITAGVWRVDRLGKVVRPRAKEGPLVAVRHRRFRTVWADTAVFLAISSLYFINIIFSISEVSSQHLAWISTISKLGTAATRRGSYSTMGTISSWPAVPLARPADQ
jgi:hypothetical protein